MQCQGLSPINIFRTSPVVRTSPYGLIYNSKGCTYPTGILRTSLRDVPRTSLSDILKTSLHGFISKFKKRRKLRSLHLVLASMNVALLKWHLHHSRLAIRREGIWITGLKLNNKTYIFLLSNVLSNSVLSFMNFINFLHQNCLILQQNWLYIKKKVFVVSNINKTM